MVTPKINCRECGNCCKSLMINVSTEEANNLAAHLQQTRNEFDDTYIEKSESGSMLINAIPCHFLQDNSCTVYEHRFAGCKEFPAMHLPQFTKRMFTTLMHYGRCPIVYHVVELAKINSGFVQ
ncbi:MAG: YkgJ family cysteine cluster protein [Chitinophagaceae bacterium]